MFNDKSMYNDIHLKTIATAAILVLIIGLINTDRLKEQAAQSGGTETPATTDHHVGIDSSFFIKPSTHAVAPAAPKTLSDIITADSYLVADLTTGKVYFQKDPGIVRSIASISKLFSAIVAEKHMDPNVSVTVASSSITGFDATTSPSTIRPGESFSVRDMLYDMLLVSSNDAATTLADNYARVTGDANPDSRGDFVSAMNAAAASLGLDSTSFKDPSGLSSGNVSSADDLFKLAQYLYTKQPDILSIERTYEYNVATTTERDAHVFLNIDPFVGDPHYVGGKTGRTDAAGETMLSIFNLPVGGVPHTIAIIVLHSDQAERQVDSSILVGRVLGALAGQ